MFIVIEGIDGAGCETQGKGVIEQLEKTSKEISFIKFPHYDTSVGKMIRDFLYLDQKMTAEEQFLLYTLQFVFDAPKIQPYSRQVAPLAPAGEKTVTESVAPNILLSDRYFTTTLCYQTLEGFDETFALQYAEKFGIVKPDIVFFLDVKPETAIRWKYGEDKEKNFREKDHRFIKKTYVKYLDLVKRQVWTKWVRINGEQPKEKVTEEILKYLL
jgi:dTMP kinase